MVNRMSMEKGSKPSGPSATSRKCVIIGEGEVSKSQQAAKIFEPCGIANTGQRQ